MHKFSLKSWLTASALSVGLMATSFGSFAQTAPIVCPGYVKGNTNIVGERAGKKVQKAFEAYSDETVAEDLRVKNALDILLEIETDGFDRAYVDKFIGSLYASIDPEKSLFYFKRAADANILNDGEQAQSLRTVGDLNMMVKNYKDAIAAYKKWMSFTCKEDADVYVRVAQAYYESGQLAQMVEPAQKAIDINKAAGKKEKNPYLLKLTSFYERKMYPQTVAVAEDLVRLFPGDKQWWVQLGQFYFLVEDFKKALATLEVAYNQGFLEKPSQVKILAQLYSVNEIPYKAATLLEKHTKSGFIKTDEQLLSSMANSFHQSREYDKAAYYYGKAAELSGDLDLYRKQGTLLLAAEDYKGAVAALNKSLKGTDKVGRIHMALMEAYFYQGDFKSAYQHVTEARKDPATSRSAKSWAPYIKEKAQNRGIKI
ncbi:tetratricopeptide repeat protein [Neptunicella marina]|uniref:Tetratricopeptide repeat protein n=1 Tax=Neptunicella marina TaxID=2125989 RepID=A0A8J6J162_9ALTE|nr:tetratricopeptide repeat protein [Neptunicella marina]MBC3767778.1 tetratricopeptide repeat protein [Neptunicella marina]